MSIVWLTPAADVTGAPAGIDQFPLSVVNFDGVPSVTLGLGWYWVAGLEGREAESFTVAADDYGFKPGFGS